MFGGAFLEPAALTFLARLDAHPEVEFLGGFCQSRGFGWRSRIANVIRRRGMVAPVVLGRDALQAVLRLARGPRAELGVRRRVRHALSRVSAVADIHAAGVLQQVRTLTPDLGLVYGAPILKPQLFEIPRFGTLGIHHGKLPHYRGKKTTFWAMFNGEPTAGVAIQRIGTGLDRGEIVSAGEVSISGKGYGRVTAEVQQLGVELYLSAVVAVKRGEATCEPQPPSTAPLYRQPGAADLLRFWYRQLAARRRAERSTPPAPGH